MEPEKISMRESFGKTLVRLGASRPELVVLDADVSTSTRTCLFGQSFPERFFNLGIAEQNTVGIAAGLATVGLIPVVSGFSFLLTMRALEQIRTSIAYPGLNVKIVGGYSGFSDSYDGATHQSVSDIAIMRSIPNMTVIVAADSAEASLALEKALEYRGPVFLRISRAEVPVVSDYRKKSFRIGEAVALRNYGDEIGIVCTGIMVSRVLNAVEILKKRGIGARVLEVHTIKPIDWKRITGLAKSTGALLTVEEANVIGGLGSAVAEVVSETSPVPVQRIGIDDVFGESGSYEDLLNKHQLTEQAIVERAMALIKKKKGKRR